MPALPDHEKPMPVWKLFSYRSAWLCAAVPSLPRRFGAAQFGGHLRHLLADPEMIGLIAASPRMLRTLRPLLWMLGIEALLLRPPLPSPPPPFVETAGADVAQEPTDEVSVTAALVGPLYPLGEVSAVAPDGQVPYPEVFART
jgi:hypothetical protein